MTGRQTRFKPPLIAHIIYRMDVGGMETGLIHLINRIPVDRYRHAVVCLTDFTDFSERITRKDVPLLSLHKREGQDFGLYLRLWRVLRRLKPNLVHTRNLAALEGVVPATLAGVPYRVHGEHGRDVQDVDGTRWRYRLLRRALTPFIQTFIPLSKDLESYLIERVGVPAGKTTRICNGVDTEVFFPARQERVPLPISGFAETDSIVIGNVGRMQVVKDPLLLARAFLCLRERIPEFRKRLRLVMLGEGPLKSQVEEVLAASGAAGHAWLPGRRSDVALILRGMDLFVVPSRVEGISNTILEAMATGLPVVATQVGGNSELVQEGVTGTLVPTGDPEAMASAMSRYVRDADLRKRHGGAARDKAEREFSLERMVTAYIAVYDALLGERQVSSIKE